MTSSRPHHRIQDFFLQKSVYFVSRKKYSLCCYGSTIVTKTITKGKECLSILKQLKRPWVYFPGFAREFALGPEQSAEPFWRQAQCHVEHEPHSSEILNRSKTGGRWAFKFQVTNLGNQLLLEAFAGSHVCSSVLSVVVKRGPKAAVPPKCCHMRNSALSTPEPLETKERFHSRVCAHGKRWRTKMLGRCASV